MVTGNERKSSSLRTGMADTRIYGSQADFRCRRNESHPSWGNPRYGLECGKWVISLSHCVSVASLSSACGTSCCVYQTLPEVPHVYDDTRGVPHGAIYPSAPQR